MSSASPEVSANNADAATNQESHFSKLPRDCILDIFSRVDRETLDESECLNKELQSVVTDRSLNKIKIAGELYIYEQRSGHSFSMNRIDKKFSLSYHIDRSELASNGVRSRNTKLYDEGTSYLEAFPEEAIGLREEQVVEYGSSTTVPSQIFANLSVLLNKHACAQTDFQWIKVDTAFLDNMLAIGNQSPGIQKKFTFHEVLFDDCLDPRRVAKFLLDSKVTDIRIFNSRQDLPKFAEFLRAFDEDFLTKLADSTPAHISPRFLFPVFSGQGHHDKTPYYWTPSASFLPILFRFKDLASDNMVLEPATLVEIIQRCYEQDRELIYQFSLTEEFTREHLEPLFETNEYGYFTDDGMNSDMSTRHIIMKAGSQFCCSCSASTKVNGDFLVQLLFGEMGPAEEENVEEGGDDEDDYGEDEEDNEEYDEGADL